MSDDPTADAADAELLALLAAAPGAAGLSTEALARILLQHRTLLRDLAHLRSRAMLTEHQRDDYGAALAWALDLTALSCAVPHQELLDRSGLRAHVVDGKRSWVRSDRAVGPRFYAAEQELSALRTAAWRFIDEHQALARRAEAATGEPLGLEAMNAAYSLLVAVLGWHPRAGTPAAPSAPETPGSSAGGGL